VSTVVDKAKVGKLPIHPDRMDLIRLSIKLPRKDIPLRSILPVCLSSTIHDIQKERRRGRKTDFVANGFGVTHATVSPECPLEYSINGSSFQSTCSPGAGLQELPFGRHEVALKTGNVTIFQLFGITGNHLVIKGDKYVFHHPE
jgi:hypothetical protein